MIPWNYSKKEYEEESEFKPVPVGFHRVRIEEIEEMYSKTGKLMIKMSLKASGHSGKVFHYIVFDKENSRMTNKNLGDVFESFKIPDGEMNTLKWKGKVGAAYIKHREHEGKMYATVSYFLTQKRQAESELPAWVETSGSGSGNRSGSKKPSASVRDFNGDIDFADSGEIIPF